MDSTIFTLIEIWLIIRQQLLIPMSQLPCRYQNSSVSQIITSTAEKTDAQGLATT